MKNKTKFLLMFIASIILVCILVQANVYADENTKVITTAEELANAIKDQANGETWVIKEGTYTLTQEFLNKYASWGTNGEEDGKIGQGNWYFPIYADNITIKGEGKVVITSDVETENGNWATQDFISIWGDNVTIDGIDIKCKEEQNKAIEVMGKNATLKNINLQKVNEDGSGSIIFNALNDDGDIGNAKVENVTLYSWISATYSKKGDLEAKNVTIDFTDNSYAGFSTPQNGYAWRPSINVNDNAVSLKNSNLKVLVDDKINLTEQVFMDKLPENTTVTLTEDVSVDKMLNISTNNVTLDLNGHTLTPSDEFTSTWENHNDSHLVQTLNANNVTIKNGSIVTTEANKHGVNIYNSNNIVLENLKIDNTKTMGGAPIVINGSSAIVKGKLDLTIGENSWYGINVDPKEGNASLSFANGSKVSMTGGDDDNNNKSVIQLDGNTENVNVSGTNEAGLATDENGNYVVAEVKDDEGGEENNPATTPDEGNDGNNTVTTPEEGDNGNNTVVTPEGNNNTAISGNNAVNETSNPSTGDNLIIYITLLALSIIGMFSATIIKRKIA